MSELLGRDGDVRQLNELWTAAQRGSGAIAIVSAEAGGGKTSLISAFAAPFVSGGRILRGECVDGDGGMPFGPWMDILPASIIDSLLIENESEASRFQSFRAAREALSSIPGSRIIVIDDLHWADGASLQLLEFLAPTISASAHLLILATRPTQRKEVQATLGALIRRGAVRLDLRPLSTSELETLITPGPQTARIARLTGGNPLLVSEYARHLAAGGDPARPPESLSALLEAELRRLGESAQRVAKLAALVDGPIAAETIAIAADAEPSALDELVAAGLMVVRDDGFRWRHDALREAIFSGLSSSTRLTLEAALAEASLQSGDEAGVASHGCRAGARWNPGVAHAAAVSNARRWASHYALEFAAGYSELARGIRRHVSLSPGELLELEVFEGELFTKIRRGEEARSIFRNAAARARELDDWQTLSRIALSFGLGYEHGSARDIGVAGLLREAMAGCPPEAHQVRSQLLSRMAWQALDPGEVEVRLALATEAVHEARQSEEPAALATALLALCWGLAGPEHLLERRAAVEEALVATRDCDDVELQMGALLRQFMVSLELGDISTARRAAATYDQVTGGCPLPYHRWYASLFNGTLALLAGDLDAAQARADEIDPSSTTQEQLAEATLSALQGEILTLRGGPDAVRGARLMHDVCERVIAAGWVFRPRVIALESGPELARPVLSAAIRRCLGGPVDEDHMTFLSVLAETAVLIGDSESCMRLFDAMEPHAERWVLVANGANCRGPVAAFLAATARVAGMATEAEHFRDLAERLIITENAPGVRYWLNLKPLRDPLPASRSAGGLTAREAQVLALLARGHSNQEIADTLVLSVRTVQRHIENLYGRLEIHNRAEATIAAVRLGLVTDADLRSPRG